MDFLPFLFSGVPRAGWSKVSPLPHPVFQTSDERKEWETPKEEQKICISKCGDAQGLSRHLSTTRTVCNSYIKPKRGKRKKRPKSTQNKGLLGNQIKSGKIFCTHFMYGKKRIGVKHNNERGRTRRKAGSPHNYRLTVLRSRSPAVRPKPANNGVGTMGERLRNTAGNSKWSYGISFCYMPTTVEREVA